MTTPDKREIPDVIYVTGRYVCYRGDKYSDNGVLTNVEDRPEYTPYLRKASIIAEIEGRKKRVPYPHGSNIHEVRANGEVIGYNAALDDVIGMLRNR